MFKGQTARRSDEGIRTRAAVESRLLRKAGEGAAPPPFGRLGKQDIDLTVGRPEAEGAARGGPRESSQD